MKKFILDRAKEASTWRGLVYLLTAAGIPVAPEMSQAIIALGLALAGLIGVVSPDK